MFARFFGNKKETPQEIPEETIETPEEIAVDEFNKIYQTKANKKLRGYKRSLDGFKDKNFLPKNFLYEDPERFETYLDPRTNRQSFKSLSILKVISIEDLQEIADLTFETYNDLRKENNDTFKRISNNIEELFGKGSSQTFEDLKVEIIEIHNEKIQLIRCLDLIKNDDKMTPDNKNILKNILEQQLNLFKQYEQEIDKVKKNLIKIREEIKSQKGGKKKTKKRKSSKKNIKKKKTKRKNLKKRKTKKK